MQETVKRRATYADIEAVPDNLVAEILNGVLVTHPRPTGRHSRVHFKLGSILGKDFDDDLGGRGGWAFLTEPELHLAGDVAVPELAGWRVERLPPLPAPDPLEPVKITLKPDWVCEVLSPTTEKYDRCEKRDIYARAGIDHLWIVDPRTKSIEAFELDRRRWVLLGTFRGRTAARIKPFDAVPLTMNSIWPTRRRRAR